MFEFFRRRARARFARKIMAAIAAQGGPTDFVFDEKEFTLRRSDSIANLHNVYAAWQQAQGEHREQIIENYVAASAASPAQGDATWEEARDKLVAVVRERAFYAMAAQQIWDLSGIDPKRGIPASEPWTEWYAKGLVMDFPTHVMIVNESHLKDWGVTFEEAFAIGLERLRKLAAPTFALEAGVFVGKWQDDYDSSRVLLPEIFRALEVKGDPVVVMPNRLTVLVAGSEDPEAIRTMLARAEQVVNQMPKPQNPGPLVLREGEFVDFQVERSSPVWSEVERARHLAAANIYAEQKGYLEQAYQKQEKDIFVGDLKLVKTDKGDYESYCVWVRSVTAALVPVADSVIFFDDSKPEADRVVARVPWERVMTVAGDLMLDTKMFPPRFFVSKFPTDEQIKAMKGA